MAVVSLHAASCACCADLIAAQFGRRRFLTMTMTGAMTGALAGAMAIAVPSLGSAAEGNYDAMLLTCIDPRFPENSLRYMRGRSMAGHYSQFAFAGAAIGVVAPAFADWQKTFWDNLAASIQLHHIPKVIAINHRDCGAAKIAYGAEKVANAEIETATHRAALAEFRAQVKLRHALLGVETGLMALDGSVEMLG